MSYVAIGESKGREKLAAAQAQAERAQAYKQKLSTMTLASGSTMLAPASGPLSMVPGGIYTVGGGVALLVLLVVLKKRKKGASAPAAPLVAA